MKKYSFLTLLLLMLTHFVRSQNGVTTVPMPVGYTTTQTKYKNAIAIDNASNKWIGFKMIGLGKYDGTSWTMYDVSNSSLPSDNVRAVLCNGSSVWAGTDAGVAQLNGSTWTVYNTSNSGLCNDTVYSMAASGNATWFATKNGLAKFNGTTWTTYNTGNSGLLNNMVNAVAVESNGNVWAATAGGISNFDGTSWTNFTTANSAIGSNNATQIVIDHAGDRWFNAGGYYWFNGTAMVPYYSVFSSPAFASGINYITGVGAHGSVLFRFGSLYYEHTFPASSFYLPVSGINAKTIQETTTNKMWLIFGVGTSALDLYCFDPTAYNGLGLGLNIDNTKTLDINEVSAPILNRGDMAWNLNSGGYEVPKGGGAGTIFASSIWIGGLDNGGSLHLAAMTYRQTGMDFWPGPLDTTTGTTDSATAEQFDYIWKIERTKIQEFQYYWSTGAVQSGAYVPDHDILTWPGDGSGNHMRHLAPYVDVNGNGMYDPLTGGDYPDIKGDEELYWIFNDDLVHSETGGASLHAEVHASAYAFYCPTIADSDRVLNYTTYYDYKIYNWSTQQYHDTYLGMWNDVDLGAYDDDYVGCYPPANIGFAYNGDMNDGSSAIPTIGTYGAHPPVQSVVVLDGPAAVPGDSIDNDNDGTIDEPGEHNMMTSFVYWNNDFSATGNPENGPDYYGYLNGIWKDSTIMTVGGSGYGGTVPTHFMFPALPYDNTGWHENVTPFDRRMFMSCGPFNLDPGVPVTLDYALMFTRDTTLNPRDTALWDLVLHNAAQLRQWRYAHSEPSCVFWTVGINEVQPDLPALNLYPNPASSLLTIDYKPVTDKAVYQVLDMTGQLVLQGKINSYGETTLAVDGLSSGIYAIRIIDNGNSRALKFIRE